MATAKTDTATGAAPVEAAAPKPGEYPKMVYSEDMAQFQVVNSPEDEAKAAESGLKPAA